MKKQLDIHLSALLISVIWIIVCAFSQIINYPEPDNVLTTLERYVLTFVVYYPSLKLTLKIIKHTKR